MRNQLSLLGVLESICSIILSEYILTVCKQADVSILFPGMLPSQSIEADNCYLIRFIHVLGLSVFHASPDHMSNMRNIFKFEIHINQTVSWKMPNVIPNNLNIYS